FVKFGLGEAGENSHRIFQRVAPARLNLLGGFAVLFAPEILCHFFSRQCVRCLLPDFASRRQSTGAICCCFNLSRPGAASLSLYLDAHAAGCTCDDFLCCLKAPRVQVSHFVCVALAQFLTLVGLDGFAARRLAARFSFEFSLDKHEGGGFLPK